MCKNASGCFANILAEVVSTCSFVSFARAFVSFFINCLWYSETLIIRQSLSPVSRDIRSISTRSFLVSTVLTRCTMNAYFVPTALRGFPSLR